MRISDWSSDVCASDLHAQDADMAGVVMTACIDATGNLQLQLSEIALAFGIGETRRDLRRDGDRAGVGKAAIIQPRASDDVADEIEIGRSLSGRIERFPDRLEEH